MQRGVVNLRDTGDVWPDVSGTGYEFKIGKACLLKEGSAVGLVYLLTLMFI